MIDWTRVAELRDEVGEEDFDEVVEIFCEEVSEVLDRLDVTEIEKAKSDLHFLKSSAANTGMKNLCKVCADAEHEVAAGRPQDVDLKKLRSAYDASLQELQR